MNSIVNDHLLSVRKLLCALVLACLAFTPACTHKQDGGNPATPTTKVLWVGVDGAAWEVIGPMIAAGQLPTFARLVKEGAYTPTFDVVNPNSPIAWTSMATSRGPEDHGITDYVATLPDGSKIPTTSSLRKARALWEVATQGGETVGVAGWWAGWPAEEVNGYVITDHAVPSYSNFLLKDGNYWTADPEVMSSFQKDYLPADIGPMLKTHLLSDENFDWDDFTRRSGLAPHQILLLKNEPWYQRTLYSLLKTTYAIDYPLYATTKDLLGQHRVRLTMLYLRAMDPVQHYGWDLVEPERYQARNPYLERDRGVIEGIYRYIDSFLKDLMEAAGPDTWTIVCSDHGAEPDQGAVGPVRHNRPGAHTAAAKGTFFVHGPGVKRGFQLAQASPYDVMPTILWLLGLPIADDLEGRVLTEAFTPGLAASRTAPHVATYGPRPVTGQLLPSVADKAMLEHLRSLGYIK